MKLSRIDIIGLNGNDGEHYDRLDGERWLETGSPFELTAHEKARIAFNESADFEPVAE